MKKTIQIILLVLFSTSITFLITRWSLKRNLQLDQDFKMEASALSVSLDSMTLQFERSEKALAVYQELLLEFNSTYLAIQEQNRELIEAHQLQRTKRRILEEKMQQRIEVFEVRKDSLIQLAKTFEL